MDLKTLEKMRSRKMFKLFFLLLLNTVTMIFALVSSVILNNITIFGICFIVFIGIYVMICSIPKNFENEVKKHLLPYLLKNIIKGDGEINWQGEEFVFEEKASKEEETIRLSMDRGLGLFGIFNTSIIYDDVFYGNYKGIEFLAVEGKEDKIFSGTVIGIPLKEEFNNTLLVLSKAFNVMPLAGIQGLKRDLGLIKLQTFNKHSVWAKSTDNITTIINDKFVQYVHNSNNKFSYMFKENYAYLIWPHKKDFFKLGSLFKKIDNPKQYANFEKDLRLMLYELEKFAANLNK